MNPVRKLIIGGALAAATITGGAVGATLIGTAHAATTSTTAAPAASGAGSASTAAQPAPPANMPAHGSGEHEAAGKPVTGDNATKAQAAAVKALGGGTAGEVTTDYPGTGYEVTVTKADG